MSKEPFLKWAGGKRWMVNKHQHLFPLNYERYVEPFLGSGAVYFSLEPEHALLSDSNDDLVNAYQVIRDYPNRVQRLLKEYHRRHCAEFYYRWRKRRPTNAIHRAARFLYLNRVCWNGLFRVNLRGDFNVPIGTKREVAYPRGYLNAIAHTLQNADIVLADFEDVVDQTGAGDFVYVDPPYTVMHNNNGFLKYNHVLFSWDDQVRLAAAVRRASGRGALILVSNADHCSIRELYDGFGYTDELARSSVLAGDRNARRRTTEVAFRNYNVWA